MEKVDITLMSPPSRMVNHYRPPLALMYVAEWYRMHGKKVKIIDVPMKQIVRTRKFWSNIKETLCDIKTEMYRQISEVRTEWLGISCYSPELDEVTTIIEYWKPHTKIMVGGIHPSLFPNDFKVDLVVRGRLDVTYPAYDLVNMKYYTTPNPYAIRGVFLKATYVLSSMGCPFSCAFCAAPKLRECFESGYIKNPVQLAKEIRKLKQDYKIDGFYMIDDLFTLDKNYVSEFSNLIKKEKLLWGCQSRVNTIDEPTIKTMAKSGCIQMDFGIERGSNEELKRIKKGQTVEKTREVFALCRKNRIRTFANYLVNLPEERVKDYKDIRQNIRDMRPTITSFNTFRGYVGCELPDKIPKESTQNWVKIATHKYNSIWENLQDKRNIRNLFRLSYLKQLWQLIWEVINQKFQ